MKKILIVLTLLTGVAFSSNAQISGSFQQAARRIYGSVASNSALTGSNVKTLTSNIMSKLTPSLALTAVQKPKVTAEITSYLQQKVNIASLATTDKATYATKSKSLITYLKFKLKTYLTAAQYSKFLNLKPATNTTSDVLSVLFQ